MRNLCRNRLVLLVIAGAMLHALAGAPVAAQEASAPVGDVGASLQQVRALIRAGEHEAAIEAAREAKAAVEAGPENVAELEQAYLLLVLSYVNYGNFQANERRPMSAEILHKEAAAQIRACLSIAGALQPGQHTEEWDGIWRGRRLSSGIYFVRLQSSQGAVATSKMLVVR